MPWFSAINKMNFESPFLHKIMQFRFVQKLQKNNFLSSGTSWNFKGLCCRLLIRTIIKKLFESVVFVLSVGIESWKNSQKYTKTDDTGNTDCQYIFCKRLLFSLPTIFPSILKHSMYLASLEKKIVSIIYWKKIV
jgi:hypothetical protein